MLRTLLDAAPPELAARAEPVLVETISSAVYASLCSRVSTSEPEELPRCVALLTYLTLSPIIGTEAACKAANGDGRRR